MPTLALFALTGCYLFHTAPDDTPRADGGPGRPARDAGVFPPPPPPPPPPPFDAGPLPSSCSPHSADFACTSTGTGFVPVGVPYDLPVFFGGDRCYCGEELRCTAALATDGAIELTTIECAELLCDGCYPTVRGTCPLPPLAEGRYRVRVNGSTVFELDASNATPGVGPVDHCLTHPRDTHSCGWEWGPEEEATDQICHPIEAVAGEPISVAITDFCSTCGEIFGPCRVTRTASFIEVHPTSLLSRCDVDCPGICSFAETTCVIPPLEPGEYQVALAGLPGTTALRVVDPSEPVGFGVTCNSIPED